MRWGTSSSSSSSFETIWTAAVCVEETGGFAARLGWLSRAALSQLVRSAGAAFAAGAAAAGTSAVVELAADAGGPVGERLVRPCTVAVAAIFACRCGRGTARLRPPCDRLGGVVKSTPSRQPLLLVLAGAEALAAAVAAVAAALIVRTDAVVADTDGVTLIARTELVDPVEAGLVAAGAGADGAASVTAGAAETTGAATGGAGKLGAGTGGAAELQVLVRAVLRKSPVPQRQAPPKPPAPRCRTQESRHSPAAPPPASPSGSEDPARTRALRCHAQASPARH